MTLSDTAENSWQGALGYNPKDHDVGIVHIGAGAFHRAHQAVYTDDVLAKSGGDWRILGVSLRSAETANALNAQNGLYNLVIRSDQSDAPAFRVIGSMAGIMTAQDGIDPIIAAMIDPKVRIVSLTITEKAYGLDRATGDLDLLDPMIAADLRTPDAPRSAIGLIVRVLHLRQQLGHSAFTALSCDNLPDNGRLLRSAVLGFAQQIDPDLAAWIADNARFPCTMVDRITPACTPELIKETQDLTGLADRAPIETEAFSQWVIEDDFCNGRPAWDEVGVLMVDDVAPYENMKLCLLNGAHSMLAYAGFLSGHSYVRDVMTDPVLSQLVARHIKTATATLAPLEGIDFDAYGRALLERFRNPNIAHETYQIAMDGSQKMPQRIFEPAAKAIAQGSDSDTFAFATAVWIRYLLGRHDSGKTYALRDPREAELAKLCKSCDENPKALVAAVFALPNLVPAGLAGNSEFQQAVQTHLTQMLTGGMQSAIATVAGNNNE